MIGMKMTSGFKKLVCRLLGHKDTLRVVSKSKAQLADECERCGRQVNRVYQGDLVFAIFPKENDDYPFVYMGANLFWNPKADKYFYDYPSHFKAYREDDERFARDKELWG